ncbi:helix-turn-helix domain-containing protein [Rhodopseudomonas sp. BR0C11]|uniref:YdaS family helix-turn-helix protein n=1 Tax=Rhodopseudomonas sp. BR0C11 TaxID=2269370 RepID=UPI0013E0199E|nr:YdaS family helix-turn-helix protein [Rhodopseudomonas sp. BR0C11]NEV75515.1 helix-turn-helix domain-containing protein [Rhodopseudomonas sp. BR0C11]
MSTEPNRTNDQIKTAALERAKQVCGGNTGLSTALAGLVAAARPPTPQAISQWKQIPAERVLAVEEVTKISRNLLRPDIYGRPSSAVIETVFNEVEAADGV